jgi:alanine racemase
VLKADGYGHGAKACARTLERAGASGVCVALLEEGIELREAGVTLPILVMGGYYGSAYAELLENDLTPVIYDAAQLEQFAAEVNYRSLPPACVHLKLDTGMGRLGVTPRDVQSLIDVLQARPQVQLQGLMTHFACADTSPESIAEQLRLFDELTAKLAAQGCNVGLRHAANTAALLSSPESHLDFVRPGIGIFGVEPNVGAAPELRPVMRVVSTVIAVRELPVGQSVGYGATWTAQRTSRIATIPMGYADGLARSNSNRGHVLIRGRRAPIVGAVSMDLTTIDVTELPDVRVGDEVAVLGSQSGPLGQDTITAHEVATIQGTIAWEVLTDISRRVPRFYREA